MPYLQIAPFVIKHALAAQLHTQNKQAQQLRQASAEDIEAEIHLKSISQVGKGILPECTMLMGTVDLAVHFPQGAVVDGGASQQAE